MLIVIIKSRTSVRDLLFLPVGNLVLLAKKKKLSKRAQIFFGRVSENFPNFSFFGRVSLFLLFIFILVFPYTGEKILCVSLRENRKR